MSTRNYWLSLFTGTTWQEFLNAGADTAGFPELRWGTVKRIKPGDYLLCYLTGVSRWIGILEVVSEPFRDNAPIWTGGKFPCRVKVEPTIKLTPETAVPVLDMKDQLSVFQKLSNPRIWSGAFRVAPLQWKAKDGEAVVEAVKQASKNPVNRPVNKRSLYRKPHR